MRFVKGFLGVIVLLWLAVYAWLGYRQYRSYQTPIHPRAATLIRVGIDGLMKSMCWNILAHPAYYSKLSKSTKGPGMFRKAKGSGLHIPANVFLYTIADLPFTWFTSLAMDDTATFKKYLNRQWGMTHFSVGARGTLRATTADGRILAAFTEKRAVFALSFHQLPLGAEKICTELLSGETPLPVAESDFYKDIQGDQHVLWAFADGKASLQFENGLVSLDAFWHSSLLRGADSLRPKKFKEHSVLKGWLDADIRPLISNYAAFFRAKGIPADSLNKYYGGYLEAEWMDSMLTQTDTVITYGYNDDFEKTEVAALREEKVPEFYVAAKASPHLAGYLPSRLIYQLHTGHKGDLIFTGTGHRFSDDRDPGVTTDFFYVSADLVRMVKAAPFIAAYARSAKQLELRASQGKDGAIRLHGTVRWPLPGIQSLVQLAQ